MFLQPTRGIGSVVVKPRRRAAKAKAVTPVIHILHQSSAADARQLVGQQDLQIADGRLFEVVTTGVPMQRVAPRRVHADDMTGLVEQ